MKRTNNAIETASRNPSVVLRAFAPETPFTLTLDGWILLEALGNGYVTGAAPGLRDTVVAMLVMTDEDAVIEARKNGKLDVLVKSATAGKRPADATQYFKKIEAAFADAVAPADAGTERPEKKSSAAPDGGSP